MYAPGRGLCFFARPGWNGRRGAATGAANSATIGAAAGGGAAGATRGLIRGLFGNRGPSAVYKNFVNRCLREKGYDPIGWD